MEKKSADWISDEALLVGALLFALWLAYRKVRVIGLKVLASFSGRLSVSASVAILAVLLFLLLEAKFTRWRRARRREAAILEPAPGSVFLGLTQQGQEVHLKPENRVLFQRVRNFVGAV